jgi:hypothetical protein
MSSTIIPHTVTASLQTAIAIAIDGIPALMTISET